jgi:GxxExxY protein
MRAPGAEVEVPVFYKGQRLQSFYLADFVCFERLIVEAKAIKSLTDIDRAQTINYLKATGYDRGLLMNFGAPSLQYERVVNRFGRHGSACETGAS